MKKWKNKLLMPVLAAAMASILTGCEDFAEWEARTATQEVWDTYIDTGYGDTGPDLADYVNEGIEQAKKDGLYTESDYSGILAGGADTTEDVDMSGHGIPDDVMDALLLLEYDGNPYVEVNGSVPYFTEGELSLSEPFEYYSELDGLGRTGYAFALLDESLMPADGEERGDIGSVKPSGWAQAKYEWIGNGGWLYNRCHLVAWSLAGENDNERNLMTGTRYFNVEGMLPFEMQVLGFLDEDPANRVLYRATPVYQDDGLLARGLLLEACSTDRELSFCVYLFNVQPGVVIDYGTGKSFEGR